MPPPDHSISQIFFHFKKILGLPEDQCNQKLRSIANNPAFQPILTALAKQATSTMTKTLGTALQECTKAAQKQQEQQREARDGLREAQKLKRDQLEKALEDKRKIDVELK